MLHGIRSPRSPRRDRRISIGTRIRREVRPAHRPVRDRGRRRPSRMRSRSSESCATRASSRKPGRSARPGSRGSRNEVSAHRRGGGAPGPARRRRDSPARFGEGARALAERAIRTKESLRSRPPAWPRVRFASGSLLFHAGDYAAARAQYERALEIRERALGPEHEEVGRSLTWLANTLQRQGDYPRRSRSTSARSRSSRRASGPARRAGQRPAQPRNLNLRMGDYASARSSYQRALAIRRAALGRAMRTSR